MMRTGDLFIETLKQIGYHDADSLHDSEVNLMVSKIELKSFFEVFCTLNDNNVLTTEEIEEYSALTPTELAEIEKLRNGYQFEKNDIENEKKNELCFLQEQLTYIENHNKSLERQIDHFKKHEEDLLQEKEIQQKYLLNAKKRFKTYEMSKVPKAEEELVSSLKSAVEVVQNVESLIMNSDSNSNKLPTSNFFKSLLEQYLESEEKILQRIKAYMQTNFQLQENDTSSFINNEMLQYKELQKETAFLKKKLKSNMIDNIISEVEAKKIESMIKYFETAVSDISCPASQLRLKLDDAGKLNEQLKKKEEEYKTYVCNAISKHVDALVADITLRAANETCNHFQYCMKKMLLPKNYLVCQRLRVETLIASLCEQKNKFYDLKELVQMLSQQIKDKQSSLQERQMQVEKKLTNVEKQIEKQPETTVFSSLYKMLGTSVNFKSQDLSEISVTDVVQRASKLLETEENFKQQQDENIKTIELIENHACSLESLLCADKNYSDWPQLEQTLNANINNLALKLTCLEGSLSECNKDLDQKQKLLEKRRNLQLARHLYVYALMNRDLFKKCIDDIKVTTQNST